MTFADEDQCAEADNELELLARLRPCLCVGAVFMLPDAVSHRTPKDVVRPALIVGSGIPVGDRLEFALSRRMIIAPRLSWKDRHRDQYGNPVTEAQINALAMLPPHWLYTPAGLLPEFTKAGIFELERRILVRVTEIIRYSFAGWLPRPYIDLAHVRTGAALPIPYPPKAG